MTGLKGDRYLKTVRKMSGSKSDGTIGLDVPTFQTGHPKLYIKLILLVMLVIII